MRVPQNDQMPLSSCAAADNERLVVTRFESDGRVVSAAGLVVGVLVMVTPAKMERAPFQIHVAASGRLSCSVAPLLLHSDSTRTSRGAPNPANPQLFFRVNGHYHRS